MKHARILIPALAALMASQPGLAAEMKETLRIDRASLRKVRTLFGIYGSQTQQSLFREADGLRFWQPADVGGLGQSGLYSYFALTGDCEVVITYELLHLQPPRDGYGSGLGLIFDAGDEVGRGTIQRMHKPAEGSGYLAQTSLAKAKGEPKEEQHWTPTSATLARIGLRRVKKDLWFLAAGSPDAELQELHRLPFTDRSIRAVRLFIDAGGSPTAVDFRVVEIAVRAQEVAGGQPKIVRGVSRSWWPWLIALSAGGAAAFWWTRRRWRAGA